MLTLIVIGCLSLPGGGEGGGMAGVLAVYGVAVGITRVGLDAHVRYLGGHHLLSSRGTDTPGNVAGRLMSAGSIRNDVTAHLQS